MAIVYMTQEGYDKKMAELARLEMSKDQK